MKLKKLAEVTMWLPGFAPDDPLPEARCTAEIIAFPLVSQVHDAVLIIDEGKSSDIAERVVEVAADVPAPKPLRSVWPALDGSLHAILRGEVGKFEANLAAIEVLSLLDAENRFPTDEERSILNRYTGWGGLPKAFNPEQDDPSWRARAESLPDLLGEDYTSAKGSVVNAHYTAVFVIDAIWEAVRRLGFRGGRVLDPSAGTGYFIGAMPKELAEVSEITAIEIDRLSSRILSRLYGQHGVRTLTVGFEKARLPKDWFDLVISNVPFGNYQVPDDRNVPYANFLIHDYFFGRALEVTRPGGLVAFITSAGTLDKWEDRARRYMASQARLLGAIRLPSGTFSQIANTDVTTDIVFLQKLGAGEKDTDDWISVVEAPYAMCDGYRRLYVSNWYVQNPEMLIGRMGQKSNGYGLSNAAIFDGDIGTALRERIARLPEGVHHPRAARNSEPSGKPQRDIRVAAPEFVKPGAFCLTNDGRLAVSEGQELLVVEGRVSATAAKRIVGMMAIRDAARKLLHVQHLTDDDGRLGSYRTMLNMAYDGFVARHGYLHAKANKLAFKGDPDLPLLLSLENYDPEGGVAEKADVFFRRTVGVVRKVDRCNTPEEALLVSLHERGCVDVALMASLLGQASSAFLPDMADRGLIFLNPETSQWETADAYLAGNVRSKLEMAEAAGGEFVRNVDALKAVVPADLGPGEIDARIGSTWIPARDYAEFLDQLLECEGCTVEFCAEAGAWNIDVPWQGERSVASTQTFGTGRISAGELFVVTLNQMVPTIRDRDPVTDRYFVNTEETIAAREKQQALKEAFGAWVFADANRCERLVRLYNDQFNSVRLREFDGSGLALPGFSEVFNLHRHQKDAIWRIVSGGVNTLLAHVVGAGKTLTMICGGMELRRLGMASKPCYVVPNHMLEQFAAEFLRAYPGANILMASKDDLVGDKRRTLLSRIATGDWDGVLITHASFERIKMSDEAMTTFIEARVYEIECAIRASKSQKRGNRIVKELERAKKSWLARLEKLAAKSKKDDMLTFEELGVDFLFIDEAHYFKNLYRFTKMARVAGLPNANSERAFDMFVKTRHVMDKHGGRSGVVFATGTPVSNSMAEMWTMQRYLQPATLRGNHVAQFDTWAGNFGESVTALELSPDGGGYRMNTRFARFVNLPELMTMFREVADIRTADMLKLPVPRFHLETVTAKPTAALKAFVATLVERAEAIRNGTVSPNEDNMLAVTNDGRKAALDLRLVVPCAPEAPDGKVSLCAERIHGIWRDTTAFRGTQAVFCDLSTPTDDGRFSVYHVIRAKLVEMGVPGTEIAFIHDFESDTAKAELFKAVREGRIRVLLGSTLKMGVGTNIQTRLAALHHLDAPWRPSDVEQREGRIIRQGNLNEEVRIVRYVTEASFDAYIWQTLETKARFIAQVMRGDTGMRSAEDVELAALSYAEVKALASGNPLVMEKAGIDAEVAKLSLLKSQWDNQRWSNQRESATLPGRIEKLRQRIEAIEADIADRVDVRGQRFCMVIDGQRYVDRTEAGNALVRYYVDAKARTRKIGNWKTSTGEIVVGQFAGFDLAVSIPTAAADGPSFLLKKRRAYVAHHSDNPIGMVRVIENVANALEGRLAEVHEDLARAEKRLADILAEISKPFDKEDRLTQLLVRQREINASLDLDKGNAGAMEAETEVA
ncbi:DEAD/DEAH box helicase family protein [Denitratisoma oestradiolicum]|uniref:Helicase, C-terminal, partial n=1 Tax=Denitratisoma oestradiolicum TaxID=311182 RepID=A0A6S6Y907_9PROT|nr:DEAD/DEAH box helicase family protein [Denitratisoma oestradiolicum]CAB1369000.1 Helicase, C-terminal [Denitratisoma oestradiolicum]